VAVEAARSLVAALGRQGGNRVAVVAFAGRGVVRCPLTENLGAVDSALQLLRPGDVQPGGTDLGAALSAALEAFGDQEHEEGRTVVLFSDGEDHGQNWEAIVNRLRQARVIVHSIAIGDRETGHPVPSGRDGEFLTYGGAPVLSRRSDRRLQEVSKATGGVVVPLGLATVDLGVLYDTRIASAEARQRASTRSLGRAERFSLFVLAALVFGLAGSSPLGGRRGWPRLLVVAVALTAIGAGMSEESAAAAAVAAGREAYASGRFPEALAAFERAIAYDPGGAIPRYDAAATLYQLGRYADALARYREAGERAGPGLRTKIDYALGNTSLALGDVAAALRHYDACLASTVRGAPFDAIRRDAAINRQFAVEQGARPSIPPEGGGDQPRPSTRSRSKPGRDEEPSRGRSEGTGSAPPPGGASPSDDPSDRRGAGGAGGSGPSPPRPGSPEARLEDALKSVREGRRRRLPDVTAPAADGDRKDW
jgi:Ca-activated chloride channel family protein